MIPVPVPSTPLPITNDINTRAEALLTAIARIAKNGTSGSTIVTPACLIPPPNPQPGETIPLLLDTAEKQLFFRQLAISIASLGGLGPAPVHFGILPIGDVNGTNKVFKTPSKFIHSVSTTIAVYLTGVRQVGTYTPSESGGAGTGFDTVTFASAPAPADSVVVDYVSA